MHSLQTLPPPPNCLNFLSRNIKMHLLGVHFGKIHVKLLNQFHKGKKDLQAFKDHYISAADHINDFWEQKLLPNQNVHMPLTFCAWGGTWLLNITVGFNQKEQENQQALPGRSLFLSSRTSCDDGNVPYLHWCGSHGWLLSTWSVASATEKSVCKILFHFNKFKFKMLHMASGYRIHAVLEAYWDN